MKKVKKFYLFQPIFSVCYLYLFMIFHVSCNNIIMRYSNQRNEKVKEELEKNIEYGLLKKPMSC